MADDFTKIPREREISLCPCKSKLPYEACCMPYHYGRANAPTAEALMRSRYSAYFFRNVDYLVDTQHPQTRENDLRDELQDSIYKANWKFLEILSTSKGGPDDKKGKVAFVATYYVDGEEFQLEEHSRFQKYRGRWKYYDDRG